jgi:hypothetical protein
LLGSFGIVVDLKPVNAGRPEALVGLVVPEAGERSELVGVGRGTLGISREACTLTSSTSSIVISEDKTVEFDSSARAFSFLVARFVSSSSSLTSSTVYGISDILLSDEWSSFRGLETGDDNSGSDGKLGISETEDNVLSKGPGGLDRLLP